jgi:hypothetical protein
LKLDQADAPRPHRIATAFGARAIAGGMTVGSLVLARQQLGAAAYLDYLVAVASSGAGLVLSDFGMGLLGISMLREAAGDPRLGGLTTIRLMLGVAASAAVLSVLIHTDTNEARVLWFGFVVVRTSSFVLAFQANVVAMAEDKPVRASLGTAVASVVESGFLLTAAIFKMNSAGVALAGMGVSLLAASAMAAFALGSSRRLKILVPGRPLWSLFTGGLVSAAPAALVGLSMTAMTGAVAASGRSAGRTVSALASRVVESVFAISCVLIFLPRVMKSPDRPFAFQPGLRTLVALAAAAPTLVILGRAQTSEALVLLGVVAGASFASGMFVELNGRYFRGERATKLHVLVLATYDASLLVWAYRSK